MELTRADITAARDVIRQISESSDSLDVGPALALRDELKLLVADANMAITLLESRTITALEGQPRVLDDRVVVAKPTGKWRPDQSRVRSSVRRLATCDEAGELRSASEAAEKAVDLMYALFVSAKQMPKQGGLTQLGLTYEDVADWEQTGVEIKEMKL